LKCGIQIHYTDWIILKEMAMLPICDNCLLAEEQNVETNEKQTNTSLEKVITFPQKKIIAFF
jgi:hypothetical protein